MLVQLAILETEMLTAATVVGMPMMMRKKKMEMEMYNNTERS